MVRRTYRPFCPDHPAPTKYLPAFPYGPQCITWVCVSDPEAVLDVQVLVCLRAFAQGAEVLDGEAVLVGGVSEDDDVKELRGLWDRRCARMALGECRAIEGGVLVLWRQ